MKDKYYNEWSYDYRNNMNVNVIKLSDLLVKLEGIITHISTTIFINNDISKVNSLFDDIIENFE